MADYVLHAPSSRSNQALDKAVFIRDGFSWGAFAFNFLWFFAHRLWLAGLAVLTLSLVFNALLKPFAFSAPSLALAHLLLSVLIGFEAQAIRSWTLARRGLPVLDGFEARSSDEAEFKGITRWLSLPRPLEASPAPAAKLDMPFGFFPEQEGPR